MIIKTWIATVFLFGFIMIWGTIGIAVVLRGVWMELGLDIPQKPHLPSLEVAKNFYEHPKIFGCLGFVSRVFVRLLS